MMLIGWFIAVAGVCLAVFGIRMMLKLKKVQTVPFRTPGEIAKSGANVADPRGMVSTEGEAVPGADVLIAPMSGRPCLAYEIKVERKYEEVEVKDDGKEETKRGTVAVMKEYRGSRFRIRDAEGSVEVDAAKQPDADFQKAHESKIDIDHRIPGRLTFGELQINTPHSDDDKRTIGFIGSERIIAPSRMYALGQLRDGVLTTPTGLLTGPLTLSAKGRDALLGSTRRNMVLGYAFGVALALGGSGVGLFSPKPLTSEQLAAITRADAALPAARIAAAPAAAPSATCYKAMTCCQALAHGANSCDAYQSLPETTCEASMKSLTRAARHAGRRARHACR